MGGAEGPPVAMIPNDERRAAIRRAKTLADIGTRDCDDLLRCVVERRFAAGEVLFQEGDPGDTMAIVVEGLLSVRVKRPDGELAEVGRTGVGELFGELACLDPAPRSATLVALEPTTVYEMSRDTLNALRRGSPAAAAIIVGAAIREATRRIRLLEERIDREIAAASAPEGPRSAVGAEAVVRSMRGAPPADARPLSMAPPASRAAVEVSVVEPEQEPKRKSGFWSFVERLRGSL